MSLKKLLSDVREGRIDFQEFVDNSRTDFRRLATYLLRRWVSPEWFSIDDVEQELYLGAWNYIWRYEVSRSRGVTLQRFVIWNAANSAKIQLHKARGVTIAGSPDRKPSQIEKPLTFFGDDGEGEALMTRILNEPPRAEEALIEREIRNQAVVKALRVCESSNERYTILAIREAGSLDGAGQVLYDDIDHRIALRLASEQHADRFVFRHARKVVSRMIAIDQS